MDPETAKIVWPHIVSIVEKLGYVLIVVSAAGFALIKWTIKTTLSSYFDVQNQNLAGLTALYTEMRDEVKETIQSVAKNTDTLLKLHSYTPGREPDWYCYWKNPDKARELERLIESLREINLKLDHIHSDHLDRKEG